MLPENFPIVPGTNSSHFIFVPFPIYVYVPMYYPTQPADFNPHQPMIEMSEQGCSIPSTQPPRYDEPNETDQEQTLIHILDPDEESSEISIGQMLGHEITSHPEPVSPSESLPMIVSLANGSVSQPVTIIPPEPLAKTEQTLIRTWDPIEAGEVIHINEFLESENMSPQTVSLSESLPETFSAQDPMSVLHTQTIFSTDPVSQHEPLANLKQTLIRIRDPNKGGVEINIDELLERRAASPPRPESFSECLHETMSLPDCPHETVSLPKNLSLPKLMSSPKRSPIRIRDPNEGGREISIDELLERRVKSPLEPMPLPESLAKTISNPVFPHESLPKTVSSHETVYVPKSVSLPNTMILPDPVPLLESFTENMSPPKPVCSKKSPTDPALPQPVFVTMPETVSPPKHVSLLDTMCSPKPITPSKPMSLPGSVYSSEPLANTIRTKRFHNLTPDLKKCGRETSTDKLQERKEGSPPKPVSLPEIVSTPKTAPNLLSVFAPKSLPKTVFSPVAVPSPKTVSPLDSVSPTESVSPPEPRSNTKQTLENNPKCPLIRIWVSNDCDHEINTDELLTTRNSLPEPVSPSKSQSETMSLPKPGSKTMFFPESLPLPKTVSPPDPVYVLSKSQSLPEPVPPPKAPANTERTLIRIWVSSDGGHKMSTNEFLGKRAFSPQQSLSPNKSLPETVSSPSPVAQDKHLSSLNTVSSTEPVSLPKTVSLPQSVFSPKSVSSTKTVSSHGPVLPKIMSKPKPESEAKAVFLSESVHLPVSPPKLSKTVSLPRTVSPPKPVSRRRTLTPVPLMWGDIMDALDAEQEEKKLIELKKDVKFTESREKVEKYRLSAKSRHLTPQTLHSKHTKGVELSIRGMDLSIDKQRLYKEFLPFGDIISAKVIMKNGLSKGYGFVVYSTQMDAEAAIRQMNGKVVGEKPLVVVLTPKTKSKR